MSETGDDCYFYYYSTCAKGDTCPFRHQPAALGCEMTCHLWERGRCFKKACNFRHMVIEKERNTIPCFWESQPMGCTKSNCSFLHTKPRQSGSLPPHPGPVMTGTRMPVHSSANHSIPTLHNNMRPPNPQMRPMNPQGPRGSAPTRPPMYNGPGMPFNQAPYMSGPRPMGYEGFIPRGQPSLMMYQMQNSMQYPGVVPPGMMPNMMNQPRGNFPYSESTGRRNDYDDESDDYTSSDYSDVSISDGENDRRSRQEEYSRRSVRSPRHQSSRREVRQSNSSRDKRSETSRSSKEKDRKYDRRKERMHRADKEKEKEKMRSKDVAGSPSKSKKKCGEKDSTNEWKKDDKSPEKEKSEKESSESDIKVKTLEEILREKALKNLHERTAQKKKAQMKSEKNAKTNSEDEANDESPEPIIKSVVSVNKTESTTSSKETQETGDGTSITKTKTEPEKKAQLRTAKTIIRSIIENDNQNNTLSIETASKKLVRKIVIGSDGNSSSQKPNTIAKESNKEASNEPATSDVTTIKIKTLEEIRKEKQNRKELETKEKDLLKMVITEDMTLGTEDKQVVADGKSKSVNVKPPKGRKISIKKKDEDVAASTSNVLKRGGNLLLKRRLCKAEIKDLKKGKDEQLKDDHQSKADKNETSVEKSKIIIVKSFDEIMKEKRERQMKQGQEQQEKPATQATTVMTIKRPTLIRKKETDKPEVQQGEPKKFTSRKLRIVRQQRNPSKSSISANVQQSSVDTSSTPASPNQSEPSSPTCNNPATSMSDVLVSTDLSLADQPLPGKSNLGTGNQTSLSDVGSRALEKNESECVDDNADDDDDANDDEDADADDANYEVADDDADEDYDNTNADDDDGGEDANDDDNESEDDNADDGEQDDDDDESWQHEELPEVPMDTPILEGPTLMTFPTETPKTEAVIHIPGKTNLVGHQTTSPTKRPRSSLEELFGVPCDDDEPGLGQKPQIQDEEEDISPAKRVKTYQDTREAIVQAVNQELSKTEDDFDIDLELEKEIANLSPGRPHDDSHEGYNEDDLLLELDEMIND